MTKMPGPKEKDLRVLSIQSHVVHGFVGNKCAVFPSQIAGFDVDTINSVQFSNHTGYGKWTGEVLTSDQLRKLYEGLCTNSLTEYTHVQTGYTSSADCLREIGRIIADLRTNNPDLIYVCDPVMGDNGKFYVSEDVVPVYRDVLIPLANVVTPNQFELQLITGITITNQTDIRRAMRNLHERGVCTVVVTSLDAQEKEPFLIGFGSQITPDKTIRVYKFEVPRLDAYFVGTGDLFTSSLLIWLQKTNLSLQPALEKVLSTLQDVLKRTLEYAKSQCGNKKPTSKNLELRLIQSKDDLLSPKSEVKVTQIDSYRL